jgi:hypothetical protein
MHHDNAHHRSRLRCIDRRPGSRPRRAGAGDPDRHPDFDRVSKGSAVFRVAKERKRNLRKPRRELRCSVSSEPACSSMASRNSANSSRCEPARWLAELATWNVSPVGCGQVRKHQGASMSDSAIRRALTRGLVSAVLFVAQASSPTQVRSAMRERTNPEGTNIAQFCAPSDQAVGAPRIYCHDGTG